MTAIGAMIHQFWFGMATHLWQSTLVIAFVAVIALMIRRSAPARFLNALWWAGLLKLFLPLPLLSEPVRRLISLALTGRSGAEAGVTALPSMLIRASGVLEPVTKPAASIIAGLSDGHLLLITVVWTVTAATLILTWIIRAPKRIVPASCIDAHCSRRLSKAMEYSGIRASAIVVSEGAIAPAVAGIVRPRIVLSEEVLASLSVDELRGVLLHEDAHRRRFDPLRAVAKRAAIALLFFYPPLWLLLRALGETSEMACDEAVLNGGVKPKTFASALTHLLQLELEPARTPAAIRLGGSSLIRRRFERLGQPWRFKPMARHRIALVVAVMAVVAASVFPLSSTAVPYTEDCSPPAGEADRSPAPEDVAGEDAEPTTMPIVIKQVTPEYPEVARANKIAGVVILDITIGTDGTVGDIHVKQDVPDCPEIAEAAILAVGQWLFRPALKDDEPVEVTITVPVRFSLNGNKDSTDGALGEAGGSSGEASSGSSGEASSGSSGQAAEQD